jgi:hypothetical protein
MGSANEKKICDLHKCFECNDVVLEFKKKKDLCKCFRCPKAYDLKHRPRDVHVLGNEYFLCITHVNEEENMPEIGNDVQEKMEKRKHVVSKHYFLKSFLYYIYNFKIFTHLVI